MTIEEAADSISKFIAAEGYYNDPLMDRIARAVIKSCGKDAVHPCWSGVAATLDWLYNQELLS